MLMIKENEVRTRQQVNALHMPAATDSWHPMAFGTALDVLEDTIGRYGLAVSGETIGLARNDAQLFAAFNIHGDTDEHLLTLAVRGSLNKTLSWSVVAGLTVSACSNLDLWSGSAMFVRKNTRYVERDFMALADKLVRGSLGHYAEATRQLDAWKAIPADLDTGFDVLGRMYGHNVLTSRQFGAAVDEWKLSSIDSHKGDRSAHGLYAAVTQGLKQGSSSTIVQRHCRARDYFANVIEA